MAMLCHRCGENLDASDLFCPNCGSPQVKFDPPEEEGEPSGIPGTVRQTGPRGISWPQAVRAALVTGIPSGILSAVSVLSWGCCLWVGGGAALSVALYRKRAPSTHALDARAGMRIGALVGLIAAYVSVAVTAISRVIERFALHRGAEIDRFYEMVIQQSSALIGSNPAAEAQWQSWVHFLLTPDGRATYMLLNAVTTSLGIVAISVLGGAVGVRFFPGRKTL